MSGTQAPSGRDEKLRRRLWRILALVTGVLVASTTGVLLVEAMALQHSSNDYAAARPVAAVEIDNSGGAVEVGAGPAGLVTMHQQLGWVLERPIVQRSWDHDTLKLTVVCPSRGALVGMGCQAEVRLRVPVGTAVHSLASTGDTTVTGLSGRLDLRSYSGTTTLRDVSGPVTVSSTSGPIQGDRLRSAQIRAQSLSGPVSLTFADPPSGVTASSSFGPVDVGVPRGAHYRVAEHSNGPTSLDDGLDDPTATRTITADSRQGPVDVSYVS